MSTPQKADSPDHEIELGGAKLQIRFSIRATMALKDRWGFKTESEVQKRLVEISKEPQLENFIEILWAALRKWHPEMTYEDVLDLADMAGPNGLQVALERLMVAINASTPPSSAAETGKKKA